MRSYQGVPAKLESKRSDTVPARTGIESKRRTVSSGGLVRPSVGSGLSQVRTRQVSMRT